MTAFPISIEEYEKLNPVVTLNHAAATVQYCTPNKLTAWRVNTLFSKEPYTLEWIAEFGGDEVLVDIGANVGMYTVWAARTRGIKVFAFEPESQNYALLNRKILLNGLTEQVRAYCAGLSNETGFGDMYLSELKIGGSCHAVGDPQFQARAVRNPTGAGLPFHHPGCARRAGDGAGAEPYQDRCRRL
jgi:hypothetical protein